MIEEKIRIFTAEHSLLRKNDRVLVAYSGGPDSTCLLMILRKLFPDVSAVYVNHQLRGKESQKEELFVKTFCGKRNIPLFIERIYWKKTPSNVEQAARKRRYRHLEKAAAENRFNRVALAHQKNDVVETFLFRLIRGSGPLGLARMAARRGIYVRPMLQCSRDEILAYLKEHRIPYFKDTSNEKLTFTRNKIRKKLIPQIEQLYNPAFADAVERSARWIEEQNEVTAQLLKPYEALLIRRKKLWTLDRASFLNLHPALQKAVLRMSIRRIDPNFKMTSRTLHRWLAAIHEKASMELPGYLKMTCEESACTFQLKQERTGSLEVDIPAVGDYDFPAGNKTLRFSLTKKRRSPKATIAQLDADKTTFPLYIRNWKKGDAFRPLGLNGTKKLSDFFIDRKIARVDRKRIPLVFKDDDLVWVSGFQIHENYKITSETRRILLIEMKDND